LPEEQVKKFRKGQMNPAIHEEMRKVFVSKFLEKTRDEWTRIVNIPFLNEKPSVRSIGLLRNACSHFRGAG